MHFYDLSFRDVNLNPVGFDQYRGKVCLIVNIASQCGFAEQLHDLQSLYLMYRQRGFEILAFPSNDFGRDEPNDNEGISSYCASDYLITFPVFEKSSVRGKTANEVFRFLTSQRFNGLFSLRPLWNFHKYLIDRNGKLADAFLPITSPRSSRIWDAVEKCLDSELENSSASLVLEGGRFGK
jgi:glutathione peroxidase